MLSMFIFFFCYSREVTHPMPSSVKFSCLHLARRKVNDEFGEQSGQIKFPGRRRKRYVVLLNWHSVEISLCPFPHHAFSERERESERETLSLVAVHSTRIQTLYINYPIISLINIIQLVFCGAESSSSFDVHLCLREKNKHERAQKVNTL